MRASFPLMLSLMLGCCVVGCGDDDSGEGNTSGTGNSTAGSGGGSSGGSSTGGGSRDRCHDGCIATLAAKCPVSPKDQATCERDCHLLETGNCATEYKAFQDCAVGKPVTCDAIASFPVVAACETQQVAFMACAEK
ncbi:MAG TPA: hypothetical protein VHP33_03095 [Polyangiaceae bacterium]|nr:hypothetical protein [Polyangiaceae bacterium]